MNNKNNTPPYNLEAEKTVLATMMLDANQCRIAIDELEDTDFYNTQHKHIFNAILALSTEEADIDIITISEQLKRSGNLNNAGCEQYLFELSENIATTTTINSHIKILKDKSDARMLITASEKLSRACHLPDSDIRIALTFFEKKLEKLKGRVKPIKKVKAKIVKAVEFKDRVDRFKEYGFRYKGLDTGFPGVNTCWKPDKCFLHLITGIPSHGKSLFVDVLVANMIRNHDWNWVCFSPENLPIELHMSNTIHSVFGKKLRDMGDDEYENAYKYINEHISFLTPEIEYPTSVDYLDAVKEFKANGNKVDAILIDPLNNIRLIPDPDEKGLVYKYQHNLRMFRSYARSNHEAFFIVAHPAQMHKEKAGPYKGRYAPPVGYDVFGGSAPLNVIDTGITVYRDFEKNSTMIKVWKIRNQRYHGKPNEERHMVFDKDTYKFVPYAEVVNGSVQTNWVDETF